MAVHLETKEVMCRYGDDIALANDYAKFGWVLVSKIILNRFGNPLPANEKVDEGDLREKCSIKMTFNREIDYSVVQQVNELQDRYMAMPLLRSRFNKKKITGCVFLSIAMASSILAAIFYIQNSLINAAILLINALLISGFIFWIIYGETRIIKNNKEKNESIEQEHDKIAKEAQAILGK